MNDIVLKVNNLQVQFTSDETLVKAVDDISFEIKSGKTLGIVGESGSGKSVTSLAVLGLLPSSSSKVRGEILFTRAMAEGQTGKMPPGSEAIDLLQLPEAKKVQYRGGEISMIFQEPMSSLNPVYTIGFQLTEAIRLHQDVSAAEARRLATSLLQEVKLLPDDEELRSRVMQEASSVKKRSENLSDREIMQLVNGQKLAMLDRYPHQLSGGQLQRVTIAMAISCNPTLLIADEPTTALDVTVQATILELMRELRARRGMSMMFISHDLRVIAEIADAVAVMYRGKIVETGEISQIFSNPQHPYTKGLLACRPPLDRQVRRLPTVSDFMEVVINAGGELEIREKVREAEQIGEMDEEIPTGEMPVLQEPTGKMPVLQGPTGEMPVLQEPTGDMPVLQEPTGDMPVLQTETKAENLSVTSPAKSVANKALLKVENMQVGFPVKGMFGRTKRLFMAVNDISFEVEPGETLGLVGESGCGKSTLARGILQLIPPTGGRVFFEGEEIKKGKEYDRKLRWLRRDLQIIFQDPFSSLNPRLTVGAAVMEPMLIHGVGQSYKERRDRAFYLLERVGLNAEALNRYPHEFSGGQRQRVCIARALALNPKFVICDESVSALDVSVQAQVLNLLKELQGEFGLTYIFISHDLSVVKFMSDRIMVMKQGKIQEIDEAERIYREPKTEYTRQLIASIPTGNLEQVGVG